MKCSEPIRASSKPNLTGAGVSYPNYLIRLMGNVRPPLTESSTKSNQRGDRGIEASVPSHPYQALPLVLGSRAPQPLTLESGCSSVLSRGWRGLPNPRYLHGALVPDKYSLAAPELVALVTPAKVKAVTTIESV
jgi:hypothetical protein